MTADAFGGDSREWYTVHAARVCDFGDLGFQKVADCGGGLVVTGWWS